MSFEGSRLQSAGPGFAGAHARRHRRAIFVGVAAFVASGALTALSASPASAAVNEAKEGPMMANLGFGPAFGLSAGAFTQFTLQPEFGYGFGVAEMVDMYAIVTPQFGFGGGAVLIGPHVGAQGDIALPVKGLFIAPRFLLGPTFATAGGSGAFTLTPEIGAKYVLNKQINFGFAPLSIPIHIGFKGGSFTQYRLNFLAGINF